jgi:hypothetical protein
LLFFIMELSKEEIENIFYTSLCNAVGTGWMGGYGLELTCEKSQYKSSRDHLLSVIEQSGENRSICYEDVLMQILRDGGKLTFLDHEGGGTFTRNVSLNEVHGRMNTVPVHHLANFLTEDDDVESADAVLQTIFFEEIIFG